MTLLHKHHFTPDPDLQVAVALILQPYRNNKNSSYNASLLLGNKVMQRYFCETEIPFFPMGA
jgi:hypothetical protein